MNIDDFSAGLGFEFFLAGLALVIAARSPQGLKARLGLGRGRLPWNVLALLVMGTLSLSFALDSFMTLFDSPYREVMDQFESRLSGAHGLTLGLALLSFALIPGIAEELLCRGLLQRGLQVRYGPGKAILLASLFFGALHMDPVYSVLAGILGLYLGVVAVLAGSVRASILCHVVNNTAAVLGAALLPEFGSVHPFVLLAAAAFSLGALRYASSKGNAAPATNR